MDKVKFLPSETEFTVPTLPIKLLVAARRAGVDIRYGCAACSCGTCAVEIKALDGEISEMQDNEKALLTRMKLATDGTVRLACQARLLSGDVTVDLSFQDTYSPDDGVVID